MNFTPTSLPPGSVEKVELLRERHEAGQPLWHPADRVDYTGITENVLFTSKERKEKRSAYEPRRSKVVSSGRKMRAE